MVRPQEAASWVVFLNDTTLRAISDGWIKINAVHECYRGHHVVGTLDFILCLRPSRWCSKCRCEGMCHRTERLMEYILTTILLSLAKAFRRHHTSVRIKADLYTILAARKTQSPYMDELDLTTTLQEDSSPAASTPYRLLYLLLLRDEEAGGI